MEYKITDSNNAKKQIAILLNLNKTKIIFSLMRLSKIRSIIYGMALGTAGFYTGISNITTELNKWKNNPKEITDKSKVTILIIVYILIMIETQKTNISVPTTEQAMRADLTKISTNQNTSDKLKSFLSQHFIPIISKIDDQILKKVVENLVKAINSRSPNALTQMIEPTSQQNNILSTSATAQPEQQKSRGGSNSVPSGAGAQHGLSMRRRSLNPQNSPLSDRPPELPDVPSHKPQAKSQPTPQRPITGQPTNVARRTQKPGSRLSGRVVRANSGQRLPRKPDFNKQSNE